MKLYSSFFLVLEGLNGSGKTTLAQLIKKKVEEDGVLKGFDKVVISHEPGGAWGTPFGDLVRPAFTHPEKYNTDPVAELLAINAVRRDNIKKVIYPAFKRGTIVIADRWLSSSFAYQCRLKNIRPVDLFELHDKYCDGLIPNLIAYIDISPEESIRRTQERFDRALVDSPETLNNLRIIKEGIEMSFGAFYRHYGMVIPFDIIDGTQPKAEVLYRVCELIGLKDEFKTHNPEAFWEV